MINLACSAIGSAKRVVIEKIMARLFFSERGLNIMPKNRVQGFVFGVLMSITMAYGMEVYNIAMKEGGLEQLTNRVFRDALLETSYMWLLVLLFSNLWGNRVGHSLANKICRKEDNPFLHILFTSGCTVLIMCPTMSLVAAILFSVIIGGGSVTHLPAYWVATVLKNFPMALLWNLFAAGPITRFLFRHIFSRQLQQA